MLSGWEPHDLHDDVIHVSSRSCTPHMMQGYCSTSHSSSYKIYCRYDIDDLDRSDLCEIGNTHCTEIQVSGGGKVIGHPGAVCRVARAEMTLETRWGAIRRKRDEQGKII